MATTFSLAAGPAMAWTPADLGDKLVLWLDAQDSATITASGGKVSQWSDKSGRDNHLAQSATGRQPVVAGQGINGKQTLAFAGSGVFLMNNSPKGLPTGNSDYSMVIVYRYDDSLSGDLVGSMYPVTFGTPARSRVAALDIRAKGGSRFVHYNHDTVMPAPQPAFLDGKAHWVVDTYQAGTRKQQLYFDSAVGPAVTQESPLALGDDYIAVNAFSSTNERNGSRFQIGEVMIVAGLLSAADLENLNRYVQQKWSIPPVSEIKEEKVDYTSKVPQFTFADTLAEQEAQLKTNPLILRYAASRKAMANDPHRPLYHFVSPEGNLNDPNGLCFWQGRWHLFYQAYPPEDPRQHWGHAVSDDLIHWRDLPLAIYPNPEKQCFSGSTYVEDGRVIAMYHGTLVGTMLATSTDPLLLNWKKIGQHDGIVIPYARPGEPALPYNIFDPCIWKKGDTYYALTAGTRPVGPGGKPMRAQFLHRSQDLEHWEYLHPFVEDDFYSRVGDDGACPYFWPIGDSRYILLHFSHMRGGKYMIGNYDKVKDKFYVVNGGYFNHGPAVSPGGVHAPSAYPDGKGGVIAIFNMNPARPTNGWNQIMTLPMRLTLGENDLLEMEPTGDYASLRYDHQHINAMTLPANQEIVLDNVRGNAMEMMVELDPQSARTIELNVLRSPDQREVTRILFSRDRGISDRSLPGRPRFSGITLDASRSSILPDVMARMPEDADALVKPDETVKLHVFLDRSVVEVYVNGRQIVAQRVYPGLPESVGVSLRAIGRDARLLSLDAWQMKSIYEAYANH